MKSSGGTLANFENDDLQLRGSDLEKTETYATCDLFSVQFGQEILIAATRFSMDRYSVINLVTTDPKIALHISIRSSSIIRNHRETENFDGKKEEEDENLCDPNNKQPTKGGKPFLLSIFMSDDEFHIAIDETCFCTFKYRMPIDQITKVELINFVNITQIDQRSLHPQKWPPTAYISPGAIFSNDIPVRFKEFHAIIITGTIVSKQKNKSKKGDIDFFFCSRNTSRELLLIRFSLEKNKMILKAMNEEGKYINEETKAFVFFPNQKFRIAISFGETQFRITVDGMDKDLYHYVDKDLLDKLTGVKMRLTNGLVLDLTSIRHQTFPTEPKDLELVSELPALQCEGDKTEFVAHLADKILYSHSIIVSGKAGKGSSIHIYFESKAHQTIVLSFVVDFDSKMIFRNSRKSGQWGVEETTENLFDPKITNPIKRGSEFYVLFFVGVRKLFIAVNDRPYEHRIPIEDNALIRVIGMEKVYQMNHQRLLPCPWPTRQITFNGFEFSNDIPIQFTPGHVFVFGAIPSGKGFIDIRLYDQIYDRSFLLISINYYYHDVNAMIQDFGDCKYKNKVHGDGFPFRLNQKLKAAIGFTRDRFLFAGNGHRILEYKYRKKILEGSTGGLKISQWKGLELRVTEVAHYHIDSDCNNFEEYTY